MGECIVLVVLIAIIAIIAVLSIFITPPSSGTMKSDYDHNADTSFYLYKNLHVKTKVLHSVYPQLKVMPEVKKSSPVITTLKEAGKCSNQLCDILVSETNKRRK